MSVWIASCIQRSRTRISHFMGEGFYHQAIIKRGHSLLQQHFKRKKNPAQFIERKGIRCLPAGEGSRLEMEVPATPCKVPVGQDLRFNAVLSISLLACSKCSDLRHFTAHHSSYSRSHFKVLNSPHAWYRALRLTQDSGACHSKHPEIRCCSIWVETQIHYWILPLVLYHYIKGNKHCSIDSVCEWIIKNVLNILYSLFFLKVSHFHYCYKTALNQCALVAVSP